MFTTRRLIFCAFLYIVLVFLTGCITSTTEIVLSTPSGDVVRQVGPAEITFNVRRNTITVLNTAYTPIGVEIMKYPENTTLVFADYYISGNSGTPIEHLFTFREGSQVQVIVATYTGVVTAGIASSWAWTGFSKLEEIQRAHRSWFTSMDYDIYQIGGSAPPP